VVVATGGNFGGKPAVSTRRQNRDMPGRTLPVTEAGRRAQWQIDAIGRDIRVARIARGKRLVDLARPVGISPSQVSRIERGVARVADYRELARVAAAAGLKLSLQAFPAYRVLLDAPQRMIFGPEARQRSARPRGTLTISRRVIRCRFKRLADAAPGQASRSHRCRNAWLALAERGAFPSRGASCDDICRTSSSGSSTL
jgi:transcriptional regulator with XRE-family HTH domain